jgi:peptide deformylase
MTVRDIIHFPAPILRSKAEPVHMIDQEIRDLVQDMFDTMYLARGVGLAAVQIGVARRVVVIDISREEPRQPQVFINPEILEAWGEPVPFREGCLSLPGTMIDVERPRHIRIRYQTLDGIGTELEAEGLLAICLQHEIDHLNGIMIIDRQAPTMAATEEMCRSS